MNKIIVAIIKGEVYLDELEKLAFICRYDTVRGLYEAEILPIVNSIYLLSYAALNFSSAADMVSSTNVTETHEIKELLELTFDIRKLSEKFVDLAECRVTLAIKAIRSGVYDAKNICECQKEKEEKEPIIT